MPREREPCPAGQAHWTEPERQEARWPHLVRAEARELTPVFGTAQPPSGVTGLLRRAAYRIPEHEARRWLLLLLADRVEAYAARLGAPPVAEPVHGNGAARAVRSRPAAATALAAAGGFLLGALCRRAVAARARRAAIRRQWAYLPGV